MNRDRLVIAALLQVNVLMLMIFMTLAVVSVGLLFTNASGVVSELSRDRDAEEAERARARCVELAEWDWQREQC